MNVFPALFGTDNLYNPEEVTYSQLMNKNFLIYVLSFFIYVEKNPFDYFFDLLLD